MLKKKIKRKKDVKCIVFYQWGHELDKKKKKNNNENKIEKHRAHTYSNKATRTIIKVEKNCSFSSTNFLVFIDQWSVCACAISRIDTRVFVLIPI